MERLPPQADPRATAATRGRSPGPTAAASSSAAPYWSAIDQEIIDTVLFTSAAPAIATPAPRGYPVAASRATHTTHFASPGAHDAQQHALPTAVMAVPTFSAYAATPYPPPTAGSIVVAPPLPLGEAYHIDSHAPAKFAVDSSDPSAPTPPHDASQPKKPKRRRKYNESTRAKHREVQRRFIVRKKERMQEEKQLAVALEKQLQLLQVQREKTDLESERGTLLQQCISGGVDLDPHGTRIMLEQEIESLSHYFTPLQGGESKEILLQTLRYIDGFCPDDAFLDVEHTVAGWTQQSRVDNSTISFHLAKNFDATTHTNIFERAWHTLTYAYDELFGSSVVVKTKLLQAIDDNAVVLYRAIYDPATKQTVRSVELLCRIARERDCLLFMQSLEGLSIQKVVGSPENWMRGVTWCQVSPLPPPQPGIGGGCAVQWTGCIGQCAVERLDHWRRELLYLALRFEGQVISPLFMLPTGAIEPVAQSTEAKAMKHEGVRSGTTSGRSSKSRSEAGGSSEESEDDESHASSSDDGQIS